MKTGRNFSWLSPKNWAPIFRLYGFRGKLLILLAMLVCLGSLAFWLGYIYFDQTKAIAKEGGSYVEGISGQPTYINPLLSQTSEADQDLTQLIYSGLFKYDNQGNIAEDLAERYEVSEDKKVYKVFLKKNLKWHDGQELTAADVYFTYKILQDKDYRSPLRLNFQGFEVKQLDESTMEFILPKKPYFGFLDNLTVGILPKHIWENIASEKFLLADYNLRPVGSGPYKFFNFQKDSSGNIINYELEAFADYQGGKPYISKLTFNFYFNEDEGAIVDDYRKKAIFGIGHLDPNEFANLEGDEGTSFYRAKVPRYFSVSLNRSKSVPLAYGEVRQALNLATNRQEIVEKVLRGKGEALSGPILPDIGQTEGIGYNLEESQRILEEKGWKMNAEGVREKDGVKIEFLLYTTDWPQLAQTADILKEQWQRIGAHVEIKVLGAADLKQNHIRPREYEALLLGQSSNLNWDPYPFWHSGQIQDPGLNFSLLKNDKVDKLLEEAREILNKDERAEKYREFGKILTEEMPEIFLYSPSYTYVVNNKVKGVDIQSLNSPSWRFADVNKWYVKTQRVRK